MIPVQIEVMGVARLWNRTGQEEKDRVEAGAGERRRIVDQVQREVSSKIVVHYSIRITRPNVHVYNASPSKVTPCAQFVIS
jgi:hypothetical protein